MSSRTIAENREPLEMVIRRFGDNVMEFLGCTEESEIEMKKHRHRQIGDFFKPKTRYARQELNKILTALHKRGFTEHFTVSEDHTINWDSLRLCCDGTREFTAEWTSFYCRYDAQIVFAFKSPKDAVLLKMHI